MEEGGGGAADDLLAGGGTAPEDPVEAGGGVLLLGCVGWLVGTVTLDWHAGQEKVWPAALSSTVSCVLHVGHGNFRSIRVEGQERGL